ncbi:MAG: ABC transporter, partial [Acidobacteria bacterium]|nr:ABC transporter [Acidobacteriota bacterium]
ASADADAPKAEARLVVIGDADFAANWMLGFQGNRDLFLNVANWLSLQENLIAIRPKSPDDRRITMSADQQTRVRWLSLFIIPGLLFAAGVRTWWRRR